MAEQYDDLADVYDQLVPEPLRTPEGAAAAFAGWVEGPRVLDCACGTVLCVGNSLGHAEDRVAALGGMRRALRDGGRLILTSRDWERPQPGEWEGNDLLLHGVRLTFFPFTKAQLLADLDEAGFDVEHATEGERYLVLSRARGRGGPARRPCPPSP